MSAYNLGNSIDPTLCLTELIFEWPVIKQSVSLLK